MSLPIRFCLHLLIVALFIPIAAITIINNSNFLRHASEAFILGLIFVVLPYLIAIKIFPYRNEWVGITFDRRFARLIISGALPSVTFLAMAFCYDQSVFGESMTYALLPLAFYAGVYFYFREHWKDLFRTAKAESPGPSAPATQKPQQNVTPAIQIYDIKKQYMPDNDEIVEVYESYHGGIPEDHEQLRQYLAYYMSENRFYEDSSRMALIKSYLFESALIFLQAPLPTWDDLGPKTKYVMCSLVDAAMNKDGSIKKQCRYQPREIIEHARRVMHRDPLHPFDRLFMAIQ